MVGPEIKLKYYYLIPLLKHYVVSGKLFLKITAQNICPK